MRGNLVVRYAIRTDVGWSSTEWHEYFVDPDLDLSVAYGYSIKNRHRGRWISFTRFGKVDGTIVAGIGPTSTSEHQISFAVTIDPEKFDMLWNLYKDPKYC